MKYRKRLAALEQITEIQKLEIKVLAYPTNNKDREKILKEVTADIIIWHFASDNIAHPK